MAHPITFVPAKHDPHVELMKRVHAAPHDHAEALLVAWDLLQTAHDQGILDLAQGLLGGKDIITGKLAEAAALPQSVAAIRNGMAAVRILAAIDPDMLHRMARAMDEASIEKMEREKQQAIHGDGTVPNTEEALHTHGQLKPKPEQKEDKPPSLWSLAKSLFSADTRRGLAFATGLLTTLGKATRKD